MVVSYKWKFLPLLLISLTLQIARGLLLALSYNCDIGTAFFRVDAIMRELPRCGWLFRSIHSNGAIIFFVFIYLHIARGLYYRSFNFSYILLIERIILLLIIGAAFLGYVFSWDQIRFWGAFLPFILIGIIGLHLFFLHLKGVRNQPVAYYSKGIWAHKQPRMKQVLVKLEYTGDIDKKPTVKEIEKSFKENFLKGIRPNKYKIVVRKYEILHSNPLLGLYLYSILISFHNLRESPFYYNIHESIDSVYGNDHFCSRKGVKNFDFAFQSIIKFLPKQELKALHSSAIRRSDKSLKYKSEHIIINREAYITKEILKHI